MNNNKLASAVGKPYKKLLRLHSVYCKACENSYAVTAVVLFHAETPLIQSCEARHTDANRSAEPPIICPNPTLMIDFSTVLVSPNFYE